LKTSGRYPDMIRGKRNDAYGGKTLRVDCCGWKSYREAVSYIISTHKNFHLIFPNQRRYT
jgi:hypothetical protein